MLNVVAKVIKIIVILMSFRKIFLYFFLFLLHARVILFFSVLL